MHGLGVFRYYADVIDSPGFSEYLERFEQYLRNGERPGLQAQMHMAPVGRMAEEYEPSPQFARRSAVLIALYNGAAEKPAATRGSGTNEKLAAARGNGTNEKPAAARGNGTSEKPAAGEPRRLLPRFPAIVRARDGSPHSGQIGLPGGAVEPGESFPVGTALRESTEEIGLNPDDVRVLGTLTPLYIPVSNFTVTPVVAAFTRGTRASLYPDMHEVEAVIDLDVEQLRAGVSSGSFETQQGSMDAPCYVV
ncbi:MAG: NUDIX hydrolase, partial [Spirochaetia bacterium]